MAVWSSVFSATSNHFQLVEADIKAVFNPRLLRPLTKSCTDTPAA
jgi:hypothetical protein